MAEDKFDLPDLKENEKDNETPQEEKKQIIEIPQEYYDKLEKEKKEKEEALKENAKREEEKRQAKKNGSKSLFFIILNLVVFLGLLYATVNINNLIIVGILVYIILYSIFKAVTEKEENDAALSILISGMMGAIITFIISSIKVDLQDLYTYYAVACAVIAFGGLIIANIVTSIVLHHKEMKALQTLGYGLFFVLLLGGPYLLYKKYPEQFVEYVFHSTSEVVAETEDEFILKTLKRRYGQDFTCDNDIKNQINEQKQKMTVRTCMDSQKREFFVTSIEYSQNDVLYTIQDEYIDLIYLNGIKDELTKEIMNITGAQKVAVSLYPKEKCKLIGDCVDTDEFYENYEKENDRVALYEASNTLSLKKYMDLNAKDFVNEYGFGVSIAVYNNYGDAMSSSYEATVNSILDSLNTSGFENKVGYKISLRNSDDLKQIVYAVNGKASDDGTFKDPQIEE